jgi:hypothetical protein
MPTPLGRPARTADDIASFVVETDDLVAALHAGNACYSVCKSVPRSHEETWREFFSQAAIIHDIFRNPFRPSPSLPPAVLAWNGGTVCRIAQATYGERSFERLPILADALEDAGCTDAAILSHCRGPGPHVRGCWVLDLILGKE